jgi:hypothetical protein
MKLLEQAPMFRGREQNQNWQFSISFYLIYLFHTLFMTAQQTLTKNCVDNIEKNQQQFRFKNLLGQYVQVPIAEINNSMTPRTSASIALMHTHNMNGSVKLFDLNSKKVVTRDRWSEVELMQEIIDRINKIATSKKNQIGNSNLQITVSVNDRSVDDDEEVEHLEEI